MSEVPRCDFCGVWLPDGVAHYHEGEPICAECAAQRRRAPLKFLALVAVAFLISVAVVAISGILGLD